MVSLCSISVGMYSIVSAFVRELILLIEMTIAESKHGNFEAITL